MDLAHLKCCRFDPAAMDQFLDKWRTDLAELIATLDAKVEDEEELFTEDARRNEIAEWILDSFPLPEEDFRWHTPSVIQMVGEWFMNGAGDDLSPNTEEWNVWVDVIYPGAIPSILATLTTAYARLLSEGKEDNSGFSTCAPSLIRYLAEALESDDCVFYCHECPA